MAVVRMALVVVVVDRMVAVVVVELEVVAAVVVATVAARIEALGRLHIHMTIEAIEVGEMAGIAGIVGRRMRTALVVEATLEAMVGIVGIAAIVGLRMRMALVVVEALAVVELVAELAVDMEPLGLECDRIVVAVAE